MDYLNKIWSRTCRRFRTCGYDITECLDVFWKSSSTRLLGICAWILETDPPARADSGGEQLLQYFVCLRKFLAVLRLSLTWSTKTCSYSAEKVLVNLPNFGIIVTSSPQFSVFVLSCLVLLGVLYRIAACLILSSLDITLSIAVYRFCGSHDPFFFFSSISILFVLLYSKPNCNN